MFKQVVKEELNVPADMVYLGQLRDFIVRIGRKYNFSERIINAFKLSIDEAATNIIRHAYRDTRGNITIRAIIKHNTLTVILIDQGKYFDPRGVKDPDLQRYVEIGKKGGLGIFMMRRLLDEIDYRKTEEGNELRMTKARDFPSMHRGLSLPGIPMSLKVRYSFYACLVFSLLVAFIYFFYFFRSDDEIIESWLEIGRREVKLLAANVAPSMLNNDKFLSRIYVTEQINSLINADEQNLIYQVLVLDSTDKIISAQQRSKLLDVNVKFDIPAHHDVIRPDVIRYKSDGKEVLDFFTPITSEENATNLGIARILLDYSKPKAEIYQQRMTDFRLALLILAIGNVGIFLFTTLILSPFQRLGDWVRKLGHVDVQDEMDIDESSEVGEIAKAFSEITQKLRVSQSNLAEQERLQKEMQVAQEIQKTLLPSEFPEIEGYEIASYYNAAKEVGGDYYDFVEVDKDCLGVVVADVSGKGVPGSLVMTMIRTALRTEARNLKDAAEVLARVNDMVVKDMKKGMFVTVFYLIIDSKRRRINYASAGHNPMILYRTGIKKTYYLNPKGFPIGISLPDKTLFRKSIESDSLQLTEDDIIIVYTDGITEAMNPKRALFGEERFLDIIQRFGQLPAEPFVKALQDEVTAFTEDFSQSDDITLVAIKEKISVEQLNLNHARIAYKLIEEENVPTKEACDKAGISVYTYKLFKKQFEEKGIDAVEIETPKIETRHISIEEKTKIYDIISKYPEYGAKRISEELNTEAYGFEKISSMKIYEELVRSRLNTKKLREAFVQRGGKRRRRKKQPGTPFLTMDGKVIIQKEDMAVEQIPFTSRPDEITEVAKPVTVKEQLPSPKPEKKRDSKRKKTTIPLADEKEKLVNEKVTGSTTIEDTPNDGVKQIPADLFSDKPEDESGTGSQLQSKNGEKAEPITRLESDELKNFDIKTPGSLFDQEVEDGLMEFTETDLYATTGDTEETGIGIKSENSDQEVHSEVFEDFNLESEPNDYTRSAGAELENDFERILSEGEDKELFQEKRVKKDFYGEDFETLSQNETDNNACHLEDEPDFEDEFLTEVDLFKNDNKHSTVNENLDFDLAIDLDENSPYSDESELRADNDVDLENEIVAGLDLYETGSDDYRNMDTTKQEEITQDETLTTVVVTSGPNPGTDLNSPEDDIWDELDLYASVFNEPDKPGIIESGTELARMGNSGPGDTSRDDTKYAGGIELENDFGAEDDMYETPELDEIDQINDLDISERSDLYDSDSEELDLAELVKNDRSPGDPIQEQDLPEKNQIVNDVEYINDYEEFEDDDLFFYDLETSRNKNIFDVIKKEDFNEIFNDYDPKDKSQAVNEMMLKGIQYYKEANFIAAIKEFDKVVTSYPGSKVARTILAQSYFNEKMYERAQHEYDEMTKLDPSDLDARNNLAVAYASLGNYQKAIQIWSSVLNCDPDRQTVQQNIERARRILKNE